MRRISGTGHQHRLSILNRAANLASFSYLIESRLEGQKLTDFGLQGMPRWSKILDDFIQVVEVRFEDSRRAEVLCDLKDLISIT